jgi:hypothetical protein
MSYSIQSYVLIPKWFDIDKHLSILETADISVDIETTKKVFKTIQINKLAHRQDFEWVDNYRDGFDFVLRVIKEMGFLIHEFVNYSCSGGDFIYDIGDKLLNRRELISRYLEIKK